MGYEIRGAAGTTMMLTHGHLGAMYGLLGWEAGPGTVSAEDAARLAEAVMRAADDVVINVDMAAEGQPNSDDPDAVRS